MQEIADKVELEAPDEMAQAPTDGAIVVPVWRRAAFRLDAGMVLLLLVLAFVFMLPGLPPGRVAAPMAQLLVYVPWHSAFPDVKTALFGGDQLLQQLPWRHWMQQELDAGRFPLWASAPLGGYPLFASMQVGVLFPLHLLLILLPIGAGLGIIATLKLWLAGWGMWGLLRALRLHPAACALSALGFMFGAAMVNWLPWQNSGVYLLLPWLAWAVVAWFGGRRWALVGLAVAVACGVFGGHPETLLLIGLTTAAWSAGLLVRTPYRRWPALLAGLLLAAGIGFGIGAIQLLPFVEALPTSHQGVVRASAATWTATATNSELMLEWILPRSWGYAPDLILTDHYGQQFTEINAYTGVVALLGLLLALVAGLRRELAFRLVVPWLVVGVFAWLVVYDVPLGGILRALPSFHESVTIRWILIISFCIFVVSAFGWDWLARRAAALRRDYLHGSARPGFLRGAAIVLLAEGAIILALHATGRLPQPVMALNGPWSMINDSYRAYWLVWSVGLGLAALGGAALWAAVPRWRLLGPVLLSALLLLDLWTLMMPVLGTAPAQEYFPNTRFLRDLEALPAGERLLVLDQQMPADSAMVYGIRDWRAQDPMIPERAYQAAHFLSPTMGNDLWTDYNMFLQNVKMPLAPLLGMRYVVSDKFLDVADPQDPDRPPVTRLAYKEGLGLWRIEGVPGFSYLSDNLTVVPGEPQAAAWLKALTWPQVRTFTALVEGEPAAVAAVKHDAAGTSPGGTNLIAYSPGYIRLGVNAARPALAVVAESYFPGWQATIDGQPANILRANYLSQGVVVPAGQHTVEFRYEPAPFRVGAIISAVAGLALLLLLLWAWRNERKVTATRDQGSAIRE